MKRKAESLDEPDPSNKSKRRAVTSESQFREGLFDEDVLNGYTKSYGSSKPYRHAVIPDLISTDLLRNVRSEIQKLSFTPKETDIYKIHQSGDLANLDGLDDTSLKQLPSLLALRNAMYSPEFRSYLSTITDSGPLSGKKTDMAINVYTPGCHLLCHDDVIGSRRVSYILYLTDPDTPWQKEWGGALRLYPTQSHTEEDGEVTKVPSPDFTVSIPPAFNQLSFFAVQPGESFHDVEEVYAESEQTEKPIEENRVRMAISGWYHIPQEGEDGYEEGLEKRLAEKSSLMQLQSKGDKYDLPQSKSQSYHEVDQETGMPTPSSQEDSLLSEDDFNFLLKYIAPTYLTPDTLESVSGIFAEECSVCVETFLSRKFSDSVKDYIQSQESEVLDTHSSELEAKTTWSVARPPHKHRFLYQQGASSQDESSPLTELHQTLFPSKAFQKWLSLATSHQITTHNSLIRRFRRGQDYTLATGYEEESPRIELCLGLTPTSGWGEDQPGDEDQPDETIKSADEAAEQTKKNELTKDTDTVDSSNAVGGYLAYMAGDENDDDSGSEGGSDHGVEVPLDMSTGARSTKASNPKKAKQDPAIYQSSGVDEDDGVLFSMPAGWNRLALVLRDKGTMRFVKYVSRMAKGDRWDVVGEFDIVDEGDDDDDDHDNEDGHVGSASQTNDVDEEGGHDDDDDDDDDEEVASSDSDDDSDD